MKHSLVLVKVIEQGGRSAHYWDDDVFARSRPDIVSHIYREHVETYLAFHRVKDSTKSLWYKALAWLRGLERRCRHRVFTKEPQMDPAWWDKHVRLIVSRRPTGTNVRLTLPLEDEIPLFMKAVAPHVVAWLLELVDPRKLEVAMYPKTLIQGVYVQIRQHGDFEEVAQRVKTLYPEISRPVRKKDFDEAFYPTRLGHWPGLRLRPPFFPDLADVQPAPSTTLPFQGKYLVISAHLQDAFAKACIVNATAAMLDEVKITNTSFTPPIGICVDSPQTMQTLMALDKIHPRSFRFNDAQSPYFIAATTLTPRIRFDDDGKIKIPENAMEGYEMSFPLTYLRPRVTGGMPEIAKEEEFYEVKLDDANYVHLSSYVGFGLRVRHTILTLTKPQELQGQGVCIVVPDGLSQEKTENVMLTCIAFLQGLGLRDLKLLSESACYAACMGSIASIRKSLKPTCWASVHDGPLACQALGVQHIHVNDAIKDLWNDKYRGPSLKDFLLARIRDFLLDHDKVRSAIETLVHNRFAGRAAVVEAIRVQMPEILHHLDTQLWSHDATSIVLNPSGSHMAPITIDVTQASFCEWVTGCFGPLEKEAWWEEFKRNADKCSGVLVSGGLFESCPKAALKAFQDLLGLATKATVKAARLHMLHGACLIIYYERGCRHLLLSIDDPTGLPIVRLSK